MEAQGDLLADYFALKHLRAPAAMRQRRYAGSLLLYEEVLAGFLADPGSVANLPRDWGRCLLATVPKSQDECRGDARPDG